MQIRKTMITMKDIMEFYKISMFLSFLVVAILFFVGIVNENNTTTLILAAIITLVVLSNVYILLIVKYLIRKIEEAGF